jgi:hypothetical protein
MGQGRGAARLDLPLPQGTTKLTSAATTAKVTVTAGLLLAAAAALAVWARA